jgi:hypothetical protein
VDIRASDEDRERVVQVLQRHTAAGRLTLDEFAERVDVAHCARTLGDLAVVTRDLPAEPAGAATGADPDGRGRRELLLVFLAATIALLVLGVAFALSRG